MRETVFCDFFILKKRPENFRKENLQKNVFLIKKGNVSKFTQNLYFFILKKKTPQAGFLTYIFNIYSAKDFLMVTMNLSNMTI